MYIGMNGLPFHPEQIPPAWDLQCVTQSYFVQWGSSITLNNRSQNGWGMDGFMGHEAHLFSDLVHNFIVERSATMANYSSVEINMTICGTSVCSYN